MSLGASRDRLVVQLIVIAVVPKGRRTLRRQAHVTLKLLGEQRILCRKAGRHGRGARRWSLRPHWEQTTPESTPTGRPKAQQKL